MEAGESGSWVSNVDVDFFVAVVHCWCSCPAAGGFQFRPYATGCHFALLVCVGLAPATSAGLDYVGGG
ncbi:hypothetical protein Nepgr_003988 [Nepenthes gracilis]|uniref:Uncharacterized protein n=1 Tax=Nepenthes gracilis TaxID=150966 RepID=A0AAD3S0M4_NEPGR|nr:hypothetical protein Nepgr_003988 [Nepenthes gracilis]